MKVTSILSAVLIAAGIAMASPALAAAQAFDGVISDTMCGKKHMMSGKNDAECVLECVKAGAGYALVSGDKVYTLVGQSKAIAPLAGRRVHIEGDLKSGGTIAVTKINPAK